MKINTEFDVNLDMWCILPLLAVSIKKGERFIGLSWLCLSVTFDVMKKK